MPPARHGWFPLLLLLASCTSRLGAQATTDAEVQTVQVTAKLAPTQHQMAHNTAHNLEKPPPAVMWLSPLPRGAPSPVTPSNFTLLQKNKMFTPHLLVVPVGSNVAFPNADPFFHNVFSLFDGRRFDLGLYEAGSTRSVLFSREGVSYIFCNIHSEMSAVVISLATPYYGLADAQGVFHMRDVPEGEYDLHVWIEGQKQSSLDRLTRRVHIAGDSRDLGEIVPGQPEKQQHLNKFGQPYGPDSHPIY
jgi:plastocyanin